MATRGARWNQLQLNRFRACVCHPIRRRWRRRRWRRWSEKCQGTGQLLRNLNKALLIFCRAFLDKEFFVAFVGFGFLHFWSPDFSSVLVPKLTKQTNKASQLLLARFEPSTGRFWGRCRTRELSLTSSRVFKRTCVFAQKNCSKAIFEFLKTLASRSIIEAQMKASFVRFDRFEESSTFRSQTLGQAPRHCSVVILRCLLRLKSS